MRSKGSIFSRPGAGLSSSEPSTGAHWTPVIGIASRRLRTSDRRASISMRPTSRHSSVSPSKGIPRLDDAGRAASTAGLGCAGFFCPRS